MTRARIDPQEPEYTDDVEVIPPASEQAQAHRLWRDYVAQRMREIEAEAL